MVPTEVVATGPDEDVDCRVLDKEFSIVGEGDVVPGMAEGVPGLVGILLEVSRSWEVIDGPVTGRTRLRERMSSSFKRKGQFRS